MLKHRSVAATVLFLFLAGAANAQEPTSQWAIRGATLIDGTDAPPVGGSLILGVGERVACVGTERNCPIPGNAVILDAAGKWVIPGLIDTHVHLDWTRESDARRAQLLRFASGNTTTREAGTPGQLEEHLSRRRVASSASTPEPRIVVSALISKEHEDWDANAGLADLLRRLIGLGADAIKIKGEFSDMELGEIVNTAHAGDVPVFGHTWESGRSGLTSALSAGVDGLSHMTTFSGFGARDDASRPAPPGGIDHWVWAAEQWHYQDEARLMTAVDVVVRNNVWVEPLLVVEKTFTLPYPLSGDLAYLRGVPSLKQLVRPWIPYGPWGWPALSERRARIDAVYARICELVRRLHQRGGIVVTGTDGMEPGPALLDEVRLLTGCGLSAMAALRAATQQAAAALARPDIGTIERGQLADLVILDADPLADPANLRRVWRVVKGGHVHDPVVLLGPMVEGYERQQQTVWGLRLLGGGLLAAGLIVGRNRGWLRRRQART